MHRFLFALILLGRTLPAGMITTAWTGAADNSWTNVANWDQGVPQNGGANIYNVVIATAANNPLQLATSVGISGLSLAAGSGITVSTASLALAGGGSYSNQGDIRIESGALIANPAGSGTVTLAGSGTLTLASGQVGGPASATLENGASHTIQGYGMISTALSNLGTVTANGGGVLNLQAAVTNAGTIQSVSGGGLTFNSSLDNTGAVIADHSTATFNSLTVTGSGALTARNTGTLTFNSGLINGAVTANDTSVVNLNGSTLLGSLSVNGTSTANLNAATAAGTTQVASGAAILISGGAPSYLRGGLANDGQVTVAASALSLDAGLVYTNNGNIRVENGVLGINPTGSSTVTLGGSGTLTLANGQIIGSGGATLENGPAHAIEGYGTIASGLSNHGTVTASGGILNLYGSVTNTGTIQSVAGGALNFSLGALDNTGGTIIADHSTATFTGVMQTGSGMLIARNSGALEFNSSMIEGTVVANDNSVVNFSGAALVGDLNANGASTVNLNGATLAGITQIASGATLQTVSGGSVSYLRGGLINNGQVTAAAGLSLDAGGGYINNGNIRLETGGGLMVNPVGSATTVTLGGSGTLTLAGGAIVGNGSATLENGANHTIQGNGTVLAGLSNHGTVTASGGVLNLYGAVTNTGTIQSVAGGELNISATTMNNAGGTVIADHSTVAFNGATVTGQGALTAQNSGALTLRGMFDGTVNANDNSVVNLGNAYLTGNLNANGTSTVNWNGGTLTGVTQIAGGATLLVGAGGADNNLWGALTNNGLVKVVSAGLSLAPGLYTNNGAFRVENGGVILNKFASDSTVRLGGSGTLTLVSGQILTNDGASLENRAGHTIAGNGTISTAFSNLGTVSASGGALNLTGDVANQGTIIAGPDGPVRITGAFSNYSDHTLTGGVYDVSSSLSFFGADIRTNQASIVLRNGGQILDLADSSNGLANFTVNGGSGSFTIIGSTGFHPPVGGFHNDGAVVVGAGASFDVASSGAYTQDSGSTRVDGELQAGAVRINGGALSGSGTITADVINNGAVAPGDSPGTLHIAGDYIQLSGGELTIEFATAALFDRLIVDGAATLGGSLRLLLDPAFDAPLGQRFEILTAGSIAGNFSSFYSPYFAGSKVFSELVVGNQVFLQVDQALNQTPEPVMTALAGLGLALLLAARRGRVEQRPASK